MAYQVYRNTIRQMIGLRHDYRFYRDDLRVPLLKNKVYGL